MTSSYSGSSRTPPRYAGLTAVTDASGYVTVTHGGTTTPACVQHSSRSAGWTTQLTALDATTITLRFLARSTGNPPTSATTVGFDWTCFY